MSCNCSLSHLLKRSIDLIDSGRASCTDDGDINNNNITTAKAKEIEKGDTPTSKCTSTTKVHKKKKVSFNASCAPPNKLISASDSLQAYELLMHAVSIFSSPLLASSSPLLSSSTLDNDDDKDSEFNNINASISWEEINVIVDIYRALIVTSNLLLEFLPTSDDKATDNDDDDDHTLINVLSTANTQQQQCCPMQCTNNDDSTAIIPSLTPTIEKDILSTTRRCILLLQSLERICAVKAISQRHHNKKLPLLLHPTLINEGGDDIHDYDRSISDLYANYDWHDDGFLPHPFTFNCNDDDKSSNNNNILQECCYHPQYHTDPPSSKHERSAYTRPWILGDRIVSLCLDDYRYVGGQDYEQSNFHNDTEWAEEGETRVYSTDNIINGEDLSDANHNPSNSESANIEEDEPISLLNISPTELNDEEGCLFDIMLSADQKSANGNPINHPTSKKQVRRNAKERKKRKRQKSKRTQQQLQQQQDDAANNNASQTASQHVHAKEGFLLLVLDDKSNSILQHLNTQSDDRNQSIDKPKSIRVYAKLHPSGWLSIADSSVRWSSMEQQQLQPLSYRTRYFDLFVTTRTKCQPCIPDGKSTFQFELIGAQLLGTSSLSPCQSPPDTTFNNNKVDLLLSIDEGTGGDFMDGFEWINAFTGAANANSLLDNIRVEWSPKE